MFGLREWRQTRFYQEVKEEVEQETKLKTKLEIIPRLLREELTGEQISYVLELNIEVVQQAMKQQIRE